MWLHFVYAPARRPPPPPARLPLLLLRRLPPSRAPARSFARGRRRRLGQALPAVEQPQKQDPRAAAAGEEAGRRARLESGAAGGRGPARWSLRRCRGCSCPARRRRRRRQRWPLAGSLAPSAALTHVLLTEQNPNYSPALPPTSATLSHWAAGLFRRNNKTCQSGEGQRDD